jgi:hypothetical protein
MVFWPFLSTFYPPWATGLAGLWTSGGSLRCWTWSTVDRKNGPLQVSMTFLYVEDCHFLSLEKGTRLENPSCFHCLNN